MNRGVMLKSVRELLPVTLLLGLIAMGIEAVLAYVLPTFSRQFSAQMMRVEFIRNIIKAMLGTDLAEGLGPELFVSIPWVHPVLLAVIWAHAIICCTRVPAGEIDRGTIDVLLSMPVSRWRLYVSDSLVCLLSAVAMFVCALAGNAMGISRVQNVNHPPFASVLVVVTNLLALYLAVGATAWFFSSLSDRRGRAMGVVFVIVVASFLLNYLAQFWEPAQQLAPFGLLRYYRPLFVLRNGDWPTRDLAILLTSAAVLWSAGGVIFSRRDLSTL
jgi:ABC-type transport system involved in multi-copper enzyme maturation permease subunit